MSCGRIVLAAGGQVIKRPAVVFASKCLKVPRLQAMMGSQLLVTQPAVPLALCSQVRAYSAASSRDEIVKIDELKTLISSKREYTLIDVREPHETAEGTIPTAQKIPVGSLHEALDLPSDKFQATYGFEKPKRSDHIIFYCRSGKRSGLAHAIAKQMGYQETRNYSGSWLEWSANS